MFGTSGIRGEYGSDVTTETALSIGRAVAATGAGRAVVGRDARESGEPLKGAMMAGLREGGVDVVDVGEAATPTVARSVARHDADVGVVVTASHNPAPDNGIKLWNPSGQAFDATQRAEIERIVREGDYVEGAYDDVGQYERDEHAARAHASELVDGRSIDADLDVIVDVGNGTGGVTCTVLDELGCTVETLNAQPDGRFPGRESEPTAEHCGALQDLVAARADLGIAHDGDADRMMAVTSDGTFVDGDVLLAVFASAVASDGDRVAAPLNTSMAVDDALAEFGASVERTRVGDVFVAEAATAPDVAFGGEPSGAWIWPDETLCPDGPLAAVKLVELVADAGSLDALLDVIDAYPLRRASVETDEKARAMDAVADRLHDAYDDVDDSDGVRVDVGDGWFLVRPSGTQPLVRVTAESRTEARADELFERAHDLVTDAVAAVETAAPPEQSMD
ncbi:phosphoglucosamine mutase [Halorubellus litoreus]|uniref:Phosphoglucosamine mutase n=1 Tax=Halorubellus litoreus TaxID=755308 RepID=A0ABD5VIM7_9EURY